MTKISNQYSLTNILTADLANSRLGINNVSPTVALDVTGATKITGALTVSGAINLSSSATFPTVGLFNRTSDTTLYMVAGPSGFALLDNSQNTMYIATPTSHIWAISNIEKMRITSTGNVGIGTSSPSARLHTEVAVEGTGTGAVALIAKTSNGVNDIFRWFDGATQLGVFKNNGNVGIGTTTPTDSIIGSGTFLDIASTGGGALKLHYTQATAAGEFSFFKGSNGSYIDSAGAATLANNDLIFRTGGTVSNYGVTERMRITSGGIVQISNAGDAQLHINASGATGYVKYDNSSSDTWGAGIGFNIATNFELYNFTTTTYGFRVTRSGIYATTVSSPRSVFVQSDGTLGGISSVRESKTNINKLDSSWLMQLNPVSFNYRKKDAEDKYTNEHYNELYYGLIAEEAELVNKEICTYNDNKLIGIEYSKLVPVLIKAVQELSAKVSLLENK